MSASKCQLVGIGAALLDMEYAVGDDLLRQLELPRGRMSLAPGPRQTALQRRLRDERMVACGPGGSAANSLASAAAMGCTARFVCSLGDDDEGRLFRQQLENIGVEVLSAADESATGSCLVLVTDDAERTMSTCLGANEALQPPVPSAAANTECLYIEGYLAANPGGLESALQLAQQARAKGAMLALSFSDPGIVEGCRNGLELFMDGGVDLLFCNADEARCWAGTASLEQAAQALSTQARRFAITLGADGALLGEGTVRHRIAGLGVRAIDTNGAGDQFAGAMLAAQSLGVDFAAAGAFANMAAARVVQQYGPRLSADDCRALAMQMPGSRQSHEQRHAH